MDIRILRYFVAVAEEKSITRAAQKLYISQPALSKQLKDLENELELSLFEKKGRNIQLTDDGKFLLSQANEIIKLMDKTINNLDKNKEISGEIFIGAGETKGIETILPTVSELLSAYPDVSFDFYSGNADEIIYRLDNGLLDFGIIVEPVYKKDYEHLRLPHKEIWGILTTKNGIFKDYSSISSKDIKNIPLSAPKQSFHDQILADWLGENFYNLNIVSTYTLLYNTSLLVKKGISHAICIDGIINTENTDLKFIPFSPALNSDISIIWKKNHKLSRAAEKFIDMLKESITDAEY